MKTKEFAKMEKPQKENPAKRVEENDLDKKDITDNKPKRKMADFSGALKGIFGDGLEYQKKIRAEWDD